MDMDEPMFVVQKHHATSLHYDVRLEVDGVMKSWAVPKGPSLDPANKRLAMQVGDHPMEWNSFEGVIPRGEYGAGTVIVWDVGVYESLSDKTMAEQLERGHVRVKLDGHKLCGGWVLQRTDSGDRPKWLMIKLDDEAATPDVDLTAERPESVLTGRTNDDLASR